MITINYQRRIVGGVAPYSYQITTTQPCVTITPTVGVSTDGILNFDITYDNQNCLNNSEINITGTDSLGCPIDLSIVPTDECSALDVNPIVWQAPYTFSVSASRPGCTQGLTFEWVYDRTVFILDPSQQFNSSSTSNIVLQPNPRVSQYPDTSVVSVIVTDCYGCSHREDYTFLFCVPQVGDINTELYCVTPNIGSEEETLMRSNVELTPVVGCTGITIDWSTLSISNPDPTNIVITNNLDGTIDIEADTSLSDSQFNLLWSVATQDGVRSNEGLISVTTFGCSSTNTIFIQSGVQTYDCSSSAGDVVYFNIDSAVSVSPGATIDWSTFSILTVPAPVSPSIILTTTVEGVHQIAYTLPTPLSVDNFAWTVCTNTGECATAGIYTVLDCNDGPTAEDDSACSVCGAVTVIDVQLNDTEGDSPILSTSTVITTPPTVGTATVNSLGMIQFTPPAGYIGSTTIGYTITDVFGNLSNEATVDIEMICAGNDTTISVCQ